MIFSMTLGQGGSFSHVREPRRMLLLHFDGSGSDFRDSSGRFRIYTPTGGNEYNQQSGQQLGTGALLTNGSTLRGIFSSASAADPDYDFSSVDYSIECWYKPATLAGSPNFDTLFTKYDDVVTGGPWAFFFNGSVYYRMNGNDTAGGPVAHGMSTGIWYHWLFSRVGSTAYIFKDGVLLSSGGVGTLTNSLTTGFVIGFAAGVIHIADGLFDEFQIIRGVGISSAFTPPTRPYAP